MKKFFEFWESYDQANVLVFLVSIGLLITSYGMGYETIPKILWVVLTLSFFFFVFRFLLCNKDKINDYETYDDTSEEEIDE